MRRLAAKLVLSAMAGLLPAGVFAQVPLDPYRAASPYNVTIVGRSAPNPTLNMPNFTLCCDVPKLNTAPYQWIDSKPCWGGCGGSPWGGNSCGGCENSCGSLFARPSWGGCGCKSECNTGCNNACGGLFARPSWGGCKSECNSGCNNACGGLFARPSWGGCGCKSPCTESSNCCNSGCNGASHGSPLTPATASPAAPTPTQPAAPQRMPAVKPMSGEVVEGGIEQIGFFTFLKPTVRDEQCDSCPPNGPKPKHHVKGPAGLGCASCSTFESEATFIFGSCRQFFGEPTYHWLHGKK